MIGQRFGRLVVVAEAPRTPGGGRRWSVVCDCGNTKSAEGGHLRRGLIQSCRCLQRERTGHAATVHGGSGTPEHAAWQAAKQRCRNANGPTYALYGGRGIRMCSRWAESFAAFLADMGQRPTAKHSLDRIDNDGNYEPGNCRWATMSQQCRNRRVTRMFTLYGETLSLYDWAERSNLDPRSVASRLSKGWEIRRALSTPVIRKKESHVTND